MGILLKSKLQSVVIAALLALLSACAQGTGTIAGDNPPGDPADTTVQTVVPEPPSYAVFTNHYEGVGQ